MRDYDAMREGRELEFRMGGQIFKLKHMPASILGTWQEREKDLDFQSNDVFLKATDDRVRDVLDNANGQVERWEQLCGSEQGPSFNEMMDLYRFVYEVQTDLPTMPPTPSAPGRGKTAASSKAESS